MMPLSTNTQAAKQNSDFAQDTVQLSQGVVETNEMLRRGLKLPRHG